MRLVLVFLILLASAHLAGASYMSLFDDGKITKEEIANEILNYMLGNSSLSFEELRDASYVYVFWNGEPKKIVDSAKKTVTFYKPVKRIVALHGDALEALVVLGAEDKVVGISVYSKSAKKQFPELSNLPSVGSCFDPNLEAIISLNPDLIITYVNWPDPSMLEEKLKLLKVNVTVIRMDFYIASTMKDEMRKLGYLLDKEDNASRYVEWFEKYENLVKSRIPEKKVKVYTCSKPLRAFGEGSGLYDLTVNVGGENVLKGRRGYFDIDPEQVVLWKPEVILRWSSTGNYESENCDSMIAEYQEIVSLPGFKDVPAVKNGKVYVISSDFANSPALPAAMLRVAKWMYPELYHDVDPMAVFQEYVTNFLRINYDVSKQGCFAYPW